MSALRALHSMDISDKIYRGNFVVRHLASGSEMSIPQCMGLLFIDAVVNLLNSSTMRTYMYQATHHLSQHAKRETAYSIIKEYCITLEYRAVDGDWKILDTRLLKS